MAAPQSPPPLVSVFISSYNHARYLPACLDSILGQTFEDFELVIVDDGSSDESHALLCEYQQRYPRKVRYFWHPGHANRGISISCNLALDKARGKYLAWCGSDDIWLPQKLEQQVRYLETHPQVGLVYGRVSLIDSQGSPMPGELGLDISAEGSPVARLLEGNWVPASTATVRRACLDQVGVFDEDLVYSDWDLWIRVVSHWKSGYQPILQAGYRVHSSNVSVGIDPKKNFRANIAVLAALLRKSTTDTGLLGQPRSRALIELWLAYHYDRIDEEALALENLRSAFTTDPSLRDDLAFWKHWLGRFIAENYNNADLYDPKKDFALRVLEYARAGQIHLNESLRGQMAYLPHASQAMLHYQQGQRGAARASALKSLLANPRGWRRCSALRGILLESFTGRENAEKIRRLKRRLLVK